MARVLDLIDGWDWDAALQGLAAIAIGGFLVAVLVEAASMG